jgi:hypothetical protein
LSSSNHFGGVLDVLKNIVNPDLIYGITRDILAVHAPVFDIAKLVASDHPTREDARIGYDGAALIYALQQKRAGAAANIDY